MRIVEHCKNVYVAIEGDVYMWFDGAEEVPEQDQIKIKLDGNTTGSVFGTAANQILSFLKEKEAA